MRACLDTKFYSAYYAESGPSMEWAHRLIDAARIPESRVISSTISITELLSVMTPKVGMDTVRLRVRSARNKGIEFVPPDEEISTLAGEISVRNPEVPLADVIISATAMVHVDGRVYTDDAHFRQMHGIHVLWGRA